MNNHAAMSRSCLRLLRTGGIVLLVGAGLSVATAAPNTAVAPASRALVPVVKNPSSASVPTPLALLPDIIADGGGIHIGGTLAAFNGSAAINSRTMLPLTPIQRARDREGDQACRFIGSFTLKNVGGGGTNANGFDVYTWVEQPQGPQSGKIGDTGYFILDLKPGMTYPQNFSFDLRPGSYVFWLSIDPHAKLKQATPGIKQYHVQLSVSCGMGGIQQMRPAVGIKPATH